MAVLFDKDAKTTQEYNINDVTLTAFKIYKLRFYGIGFKSFSPKVDKISVDTESKTVILFGKAHLLGTYIDVYVLPLQNPIPIAALLAGSAILAALGLTLAILHKVEDISGIIYITIISLTFLTIKYRKDIKKVLNK